MRSRMRERAEHRGEDADLQRGQLLGALDELLAARLGENQRAEEVDVEEEERDQHPERHRPEVRLRVDDHARQQDHRGFGGEDRHHDAADLAPEGDPVEERQHRRTSATMLTTCATTNPPTTATTNCSSSVGSAPSAARDLRHDEPAGEAPAAGRLRQRRSRAAVGSCRARARPRSRAARARPPGGPEQRHRDDVARGSRRRARRSLYSKSDEDRRRRRGQPGATSSAGSHRP